MNWMTSAKKRVSKGGGKGKGAIKSRLENNSAISSLNNGSMIVTRNTRSSSSLNNINVDNGKSSRSIIVNDSGISRDAFQLDMAMYLSNHIKDNNNNNNNNNYKNEKLTTSNQVVDPLENLILDDQDIEHLHNALNGQDQTSLDILLQQPNDQTFTLFNNGFEIHESNCNRLEQSKSFDSKNERIRGSDFKDLFEGGLQNSFHDEDGDPLNALDLSQDLHSPGQIFTLYNNGNVVNEENQTLIQLSSSSSAFGSSKDMINDLFEGEL